MNIDPLLTAQEVMNILRCKKSAFYAIHAPHIRPTMCGKTRMYDPIDVYNYKESLKEDVQCQSKSVKAPTITNMTLQSKVVGFEEALKRTTAKQQGVSKPS